MTTKTFRPTTKMLFASGALAIALSTASCSSSGSSTSTKTIVANAAATTTHQMDNMGGAASGELTIKATDFAFEVPKSAPSGWTKLTLDNKGTEQHQISLAKLGDGQDAKAVEGMLDKGNLAFLAQATLIGAVDGANSSQSHTVTTNLQPGTYVAFCAIPSPSDGVSHYVKGMYASFQVGPDKTDLTEPKADATIKITPTGYDVPKGFTGKGTVGVTNTGHFGAEMAIMRLGEGKTKDDLVTYLTGKPSGPPPFVTVGGVSAQSPGTTTYVDLDLDPGNYVLMSFVPDPSAGFAPQFTKGMITPLTIS